MHEYVLLQVPGDIAEAVKKKHRKMLEMGLTVQPFVIIVGENIDNPLSSKLWMFCTNLILPSIWAIHWKVTIRGVIWFNGAYMAYIPSLMRESLWFLMFWTDWKKLSKKHLLWGITHFTFSKTYSCVVWTYCKYSVAFLLLISVEYFSRKKYLPLIIGHG